MEPLEHNSSSSNNSIEEDIQEAVEESDESLPLPLDDTNSSPPSVEQDSTSHYTVPIPIEEKSTSDERFKINPDQLFGDNLLKHFKPPDPEDDESTTQDISDLKDESHESHESHEETLKGEDIEKDNSIQEITVSNHSIEMTYESIDINNESQINRILASPISEHSLKDDEELAALKERIRMLKDIQKPILPKNMILSDESDIVVKQMERVPTEFSKEVLEDITEESCSGNFESVISLNMIKNLEAKNEELREIVAAKDLCMQALNMQLEMGQRRESNVTNESFQPSGRESLITTTSTEYRTFAEDFYGKNNDFYMEIVERDNLITQLKESLQRSLQAREDLDTRTVNLTSEVQQLRKQIQELIESKRSQIWRRGGGDQESVGQRLSEISMELVSETDDDIENPLLTDNEDRISRSSRERQLSNPPEMEFVPINKELEEFQDSLAHYEIPIYYAIRKKFDEFISQELEKLRENYESERKIAIDQIQAEKDELRLEVDRLQIVLTNTKSGSNDVEIMKKELEAIHAKEMAELSQYFEKKCADLEKQYSEEVFSLKSQRNGSSCESSDQEELPSETKELSPRKKSKESLYSSPSHRQITPNNDSDEETLKERELKQFYKEKIEDMNKAYDDILKQLKRYEKKYGKFEFLSETEKEAENNISTFTIVDQDELSENDIAEIQKIKDDYERRLEEQVAQAKKDFFNELAKQVQAFLTDSSSDDRLPAEFIHLREKFTAEHKLEITQLKLEHEEELNRMKAEFEKQINRKSKRQFTFDLSRDLDCILSERDGLRELSSTFRDVLSKLAKCICVCEDDLNLTILDYQKESDIGVHDSLQTSKIFKLAPDVNGLLDVIDDPKLLSFIDKSVDEDEEFHLKNCIEKLEVEARKLYDLTEDLKKSHQQHDLQSETTTDGERNDSCEEEDGLKSASKRTPHKKRALSLVETPAVCRRKLSMPTQSSLPPDLNRLTLQFDSTFDENFSTESVNEPSSSYVNELKNQLVQAEQIISELTNELRETLNDNKELQHEMNNLRKQLDELDSHREDYKEGYTLGVITSPERRVAAKTATSFSQLQDKARNLLGTPVQQSEEETNNLLQMIEDFVREGDEVVESSKKDRNELQMQLDVADKKLKDLKKFMDDQANERELERDKYIKDIEDLKNRISEKDKLKTSYENVRKENEILEEQLKEVTQENVDLKERKKKLEDEFKNSIDKVFDLRRTICSLETQVQQKGINEIALEEEVKILKAFINTQTHSTDTLQNEVDALKRDIAEGYQKRLTDLEEQLGSYRPSKDQCAEIDRICDQLQGIEVTLEQKINILESLHHNNASPLSGRSVATEDVSVEQTKVSEEIVKQGSSEHPSPRLSPPLHLEPLIRLSNMVQGVVEKLSKHSIKEEAAIKKIKDLEMRVEQITSISLEIQNQRDNLQERMNEQMQRISSLSSKLEEQRQRAEDLQRQGTATLTLRNHDLQNDLRDLKETLSARDKQINALKAKLEETKEVLDRQDAELNAKSDRSLIEKLENQLKSKETEITKLKEKMKSEMINKLALPDLMETILAEKNEEIDHLKEQLESKEKELQSIFEIENLSQKSHREDDLGKSSARTLSDIVSISEYSEPDVMRRAHLPQESPLVLPDNQPLTTTMDTSKEAVANLTEKRTSDLNVFANLHPASTFDNPHYFQDPSVPIQGINSSSLITSAIAPRKINFSNLTDDSRKAEADETVDVSKLREEVDGLKLKLEEVESLKLKLEEVTNEKDQEIEVLKKKLKEHEENYQSLKKQNEELSAKRSLLENRLEMYDGNVLRLGQLQDELDTKVVELKELNVKLLNLQKDLQSKEDTIKKLNEQLCHFTEFSEEMQDQFAGKDAVIKKLQENLTDLEKINENKEKYSIELNSARAELYSTREELTEKTAEHNRLLIEVKSLNLKIESMQSEIERLKSQNSECSRPYSIDELAAQVEKELNYSAQLDSNILKAIESEEENNFDEPEPTEVELLRSELEKKKSENEELKEELNKEKQASHEIQEQDVAIIQAMRLRLEDCMEKEQELHRLIDEEREKCDRLTTQISILQRSEARKASLLLKSPPDSPRRSPRSGDFEMEIAERLRSEIKLLNSQNEREKERIADLQKNLEKEKSRFETELQDRIEYSNKLSREMDKLAREKDSAEEEIEHLQDRLQIQNTEIETLEKRIATFQENETRRASRRDKELTVNAKDKAELQELKAKLLTLEAERDQLLKTVSLLRADVSKGAEREAKLAEAVANASGSAQIPQKIISRMKEMNDMLSENHRENKQMAETVQFLIEERRTLQKKYDELEKNVASGSNGGKSTAQLEERVNYLLGRYLRVESYRKSLVHQKRYLTVALRSYQESEARAVAMIGGRACSMYDSLQEDRKRRSFKTVALAVVAIRRMEFLVRRWYNPGKRLVSKQVYTLTQQKPSTSSNNHQINFISTSPPCRDNAGHRQSAFTLKSPALISECEQKFDWSRLKKP